MKIVVQHFVPGATLDTESLHEIVAKLRDEGSSQSSKTPKDTIPYPDTLLPPSDASFQACIDTSFCPESTPGLDGNAGETDLQQPFIDSPANSAPVSWNSETTPVEEVAREDVMGITSEL